MKEFIADVILVTIAFLLGAAVGSNSTTHTVQDLDEQAAKACSVVGKDLVDYSFNSRHGFLTVSCTDGVDLKDVVLTR